MKTCIVLSGCGVKDGSEIHESVLTMLHLDQAGSEIICAAPDLNQMDVINHVTDKAMASEQRNILVESARIARGDIAALSSISADGIDALVIPGGFGAAKNLCDFAVQGPECRVQPDLEKLILDMVKAKKPIGALCIAPVIIARVLGKNNRKVKLTIGKDTATAEKINAMGATHVNCPVHQSVIDEEFRVVTSPAYMLAGSIKEVSESAKSLVNGLVKLSQG